MTFTLLGVENLMLNKADLTKMVVAENTSDLSN